MAITQCCGHAFFTATAALCAVTTATTWLEGLRIIAKNATFARAQTDLGIRRLFAGRHIHILRRRNSKKIPTWKPFSLGIRTHVI